MLDGRIQAYIITNGLLLNEERLYFFKKFQVDVGISIDGIAEVHNLYRCGTHKQVMEKIYLYKEINGCFPSMNCTVGKEVLQKMNETIAFFKPFQNRITFSRIIGKYGISLAEFYEFLKHAGKYLNIRKGGYDSTMYGGMCGAGMNNFFFANGNVYFCGNCVDLAPIASSNVTFDVLETIDLDFDRKKCFKELLCE